MGSRIRNDISRPEASAGGLSQRWGGSGLLGFLEGIKELVQRFEAAERPAGGPAAAWVPAAG